MPFTFAARATWAIRNDAITIRVRAITLEDARRASTIRSSVSLGCAPRSDHRADMNFLANLANIASAQVTNSWSGKEVFAEHETCITEPEAVGRVGIDMHESDWIEPPARGHLVRGSRP